MIVRSKAPLRISFCGGGTDVSPYLEERGGVVLSATIDKYAYGVMRLRQDKMLTPESLDNEFAGQPGAPALHSPGRHGPQWIAR